jgi:hypothetical protein
MERRSEEEAVRQVVDRGYPVAQVPRGLGCQSIACTSG